MKFFNDLLGVNITHSDIDVAHRVGKSSEGRQTMLVRFIRRDCVETVIKEPKSLKSKGYAIFEDSTLANRRLLHRLANHTDISQQWITRGKVWALTNNNTRIHFDILDDISKKVIEEDNKHTNMNKSTINQRDKPPQRNSTT